MNKNQIHSSRQKKKFHLAKHSTKLLRFVRSFDGICHAPLDQRLPGSAWMNCTLCLSVHVFTLDRSHEKVDKVGVCLVRVIIFMDLWRWKRMSLKRNIPQVCPVPRICALWKKTSEKSRPTHFCRKTSSTWCLMLFYLLSQIIVPHVRVTTVHCSINVVCSLAEFSDE